jgi:hypothetical protein
MAPPTLLSSGIVLPSNWRDPRARPAVVEARDILHHPAGTLAEIVLLLMRIRCCRPLKVEPQTGRIIAQLEAQTFEAFKQFDREWADFDFVDIGPQGARRPEVVFLTLIPNRGESVLHIFIGILSDSEAHNRVLVTHVVDTDVDAFGPLGTVRVHLVHGCGWLMAQEFVPFAQHQYSPQSLFSDSADWFARCARKVSDSRHS